MRSTLFLVIVLSSHIYGTTSEEEWNYEDGALGPENWFKVSPTCAGNHQSPINIPPIKPALRMTYQDFSISEAYDKLPRSIILTKNSHTVGIKVVFNDNERITLAGGPLVGRYFLDGIHFHWGNENSYGSEHTINDTRGSMEMHAVFVNEKYPDFLTARTEEDGLAVVAYLYQAGAKGSPTMEIISRHLPLLQKKEDAQVSIPIRFPISRLVVPFDTKYATYKGSLTTPPCTESVKWIVHYQRLDISDEQINRFRKLYVSTPTLQNNFRPVQRLNQRPVDYQLISDDCDDFFVPCQ